MTTMSKTAVHSKRALQYDTPCFNAKADQQQMPRGPPKLAHAQALRQLHSSAGGWPGERQESGERPAAAVGPCRPCGRNNWSCCNPTRHPECQTTNALQTWKRWWSSAGVLWAEGGRGLLDRPTIIFVAALEPSVQCKYWTQKQFCSAVIKGMIMKTSRTPAYKT